MPVTPTYPGLYIEELPPTNRTITAAPTSIAVFIGHTHPYKTKTENWEKPVLVFSFADYEREFGGLYKHTVLDSHVPYAVQQFFLNGGAMAYVVAIQPKYYVGDNLTETEFSAPKATIGTPVAITFTGREPVTVFEMRVKISNVRKTTANNDTADIALTYGSRGEIHRGVLISQLPARLAEHSALATAVLEADTTAYPEAGADVPFSAPVPNDSTIFVGAAYTKVMGADSMLNKLDVFNLLAIPGIAAGAGGGALDVWVQALALCERKRAFAIMDSTSAATDKDVVVPGLTSGEIDKVPKSTNGAFYFPYLRSIDGLDGEAIEVPPSGFVAGIFARTDTNRGVWKAPAGLETVIHNTSGVVERGRMTDGTAGVLNEAGVNALRQFPGVGAVVFGARTLVTGNPAFKHWMYVPVRRMALFIEQTLLRNLGWAVFEPNDEPLWVALRSSVENFMLSLFRQGAFQGSTPSQAFLVKCDSSTTTQDDIDIGRVNIVVGFRPLKPAEFVIIKIAQLAGQVQS